MTLPPLPEPDTHCFDDDTGLDVWSHSPDQMRAYGEACAAVSYYANIPTPRHNTAPHAVCAARMDST